MHHCKQANSAYLNCDPQSNRHSHNACFKGILNEQGFLTGSASAENTRFGITITAVPDLDLDGYSDVVVGAPLEGNQKGAIYIYNGEKQTLRKQFSQVRTGLTLQALLTDPLLPM